jgi:hypothetical protein
MNNSEKYRYLRGDDERYVFEWRYEPSTGLYEKWSMDSKHWICSETVPDLVKLFFSLGLGYSKYAP